VGRREDHCLAALKRRLAASLCIAENGYAALNPPLAGERRGALSTRTTHPLVLSRVRETLHALGGQAESENPFTAMT